MATNVTVRDLDNYPDIYKTVMVDQTAIIPTDARGDEKWVISFSTNAYSDNVSYTAIQDIYVQGFKVGWAKSTDVSGPFTIESGNNTLGIRMDGGVTTYYVTLTSGTYYGEALAEHLETKIRAIPTASGVWSALDDELSFINSIVDYKNNKFYVVSGNIGEDFSGTGESSVVLTASGADTLYTGLGFDCGFSSKNIVTDSVCVETTLASTYTGGTATLVLTRDIGVNSKDSLCITDGTNIEYFTAIVGGSATLTVPTVATNGFAGITNTYSSTNTVVQVLRRQDPDQEPNYHYNTPDAIITWGIMCMANLIDFSS